MESTRTWEIKALEHPVREPLLAYKKLSRLLSANGWAWMEAWVHDGRFRPDYVPGGVVTGRWATSGGGALQLPASIRSAVRADPGWKLVVADAAQLEPRVLAAMSGDGAMAAAGRHADLYQGVVDAGIVETRSEAKYAMLGAIYGATTGPSAVLMPRLTRAYPRAVALVEAGARAGERGDVVSTWLGRTSPRPDAAWQAELAAASAEGAGADDVRAARRRGRDWGRFTRNFLVQGTAAEWALCWMASLRRRLLAVDGRPHLVFFLHDEVMVHSPADVADDGRGRRAGVRGRGRSAAVRGHARGLRAERRRGRQLRPGEVEGQWVRISFSRITRRPKPAASAVSPSRVQPRTPARCAANDAAAASIATVNQSARNAEFVHVQADQSTDEEDHEDREAAQQHARVVLQRVAEPVVRAVVGVVEASADRVRVHVREPVGHRHHRGRQRHELAALGSGTRRGQHDARDERSVEHLGGALAVQEPSYAGDGIVHALSTLRRRTLLPIVSYVGTALPTGVSSPTARSGADRTSRTAAAPGSAYARPAPGRVVVGGRAQRVTGPRPGPGPRSSPAGP